jgi:hypothetical protein
MTVPPGGPYGQDPWGSNPYGQGGSWGGQPQGGQPQGPPPSGQYPYPQGGGYPYPPTGPVANPGGGDPAYPPQQYPPTGQQFTPGWQGGPYPPGPPPGPPRSKMPWIILAAIAVVGVIALVVILAVTLGGNDNKSGPASASGTTSAPTSSGPSEQTATDCTPNVSGGEKPGGGPVAAGKLSFPINATPGWSEFSDDSAPNLIGAVGVAKEVPNSNQWVMQAEVAVTNFVPSMDVSAQATKLMQCLAAGPGYSNASPTLGPLKTSSTTVDGVKAARVDADVNIADTSRGIKGDSVTVIAVDTKPVTIFLGATPIGDAASADIIRQVIAALKVAKS